MWKKENGGEWEEGNTVSFCVACSSLVFSAYSGGQFRDLLFKDVI